MRARILNAVNSGATLTDLYATSLLHDAAEAGAAAVSGGGLTLFEKLCDDAVMAYIWQRQVCRLRRGSPCRPIWPPGRANSPRCASS